MEHCSQRVEQNTGCNVLKFIIHCLSLFLQSVNAQGRAMLRNISYIINHYGVDFKDFQILKILFRFRVWKKGKLLSLLCNFEIITLWCTLAASKQTLSSSPAEGAYQSNSRRSHWWWWWWWLMMMMMIDDDDDDDEKNVTQCK